MEIFGGFMVMMSILGLFLAVVWLIMPFVVLAMKGKQDRSLDVLEAIDKRLAVIERQLEQLQPVQAAQEAAEISSTTADAPDPEQPEQPTVLPLA
jgi:hypothetical protein